LTTAFLVIIVKIKMSNADEYPEDKFISTQTIPTLKVLNENGTEIRGVGCFTAGMDPQ
jgi:hypothetical protein